MAGGWEEAKWGGKGFACKRELPLTVLEVGHMPRPAAAVAAPYAVFLFFPQLNMHC
jgi:hypothetical protein